MSDRRQRLLHPSGVAGDDPAAFGFQPLPKPGRLHNQNARLPRMIREKSDQRSDRCLHVREDIWTGGGHGCVDGGGDSLT